MTMTTTTMTPNRLEQLCEQIYGYGWQSELARDLEVSDRTVRRWMAGTFSIPETMARDLKTVIERRIERLKKVGAKL